MTSDEKKMLKTGADAAMRPFANLIERLFGGPVDEIGGMWQDALRARRQMRRIMLFGKIQTKIDEAGFEPKVIPEKIWLPALQAACGGR